MITASKNIDRSGIDEGVFVRGDDGRLVGPLAALAWFALALLTFVCTGRLQSDWVYVAVAMFVAVGGAIAVAAVTASSPLSQSLLRLAPWLLMAAALVDALLVIGLGL